MFGSMLRNWFQKAHAPGFQVVIVLWWQGLSSDRLKLDCR